MSHTTSSATNATASPSSTDGTYDFSIKEATIRNTAIGICLALFVFLLCALIGLEVMRRRLKRMRKRLLTYISREEEGLNTSSEDIRYQLVRPFARVPERIVTSDISVQGEVFESDARSVHSFQRGETHRHNKNVANKWYDLRGLVNREG